MRIVHPRGSLPVPAGEQGRDGSGYELRNLTTVRMTDPVPSLMKRQIPATVARSGQSRFNGGHWLSGSRISVEQGGLVQCCGQTLYAEPQP